MQFVNNIGLWKVKLHVEKNWHEPVGRVSHNVEKKLMQSEFWENIPVKNFNILDNT